MRLQTIPNVSCFKAQGAFYLFPNFSAYYNKEFNNVQIRNSYGMAYYLLKEAKVAIVPGDAFGADDYIRISYTTVARAAVNIPAINQGWLRCTYHHSASPRQRKDCKSN